MPRTAKQKAKHNRIYSALIYAWGLCGHILRKTEEKLFYHWQSEQILNFDPKQKCWLIRIISHGIKAKKKITVTKDQELLSSTTSGLGGCPRGVMVKAIDCGVVVL